MAPRRSYPASSPISPHCTGCWLRSVTSDCPWFLCAGWTSAPAARRSNDRTIVFTPWRHLAAAWVVGDLTPAVGQDLAQVVEHDHPFAEQAPPLPGVACHGVGGPAVWAVSWRARGWCGHMAHLRHEAANMPAASRRPRRSCRGRTGGEVLAQWWIDGSVLGSWAGGRAAP